jgi:LysR family glycine cleavage system transcriptional activator
MSDPLSGIPLASIRVFEAAARLKSFTRAAEELGMTQAAVSWQIKALESRLGLSLFRRLPREVMPTEPGERLSRAATEAMLLLRRALTDLTDTDQGVLSITTLATLASQWLAQRLGEFQIANPGLAVRVDTTSTLTDLTRENVDIAIRSGTGTWPGLESALLMPSVFTPLCTPALCEKLNLQTPADLIAAPRIGEEKEWGPGSPRPESRAWPTRPCGCRRTSRRWRSRRRSAARASPSPRPSYMRARSAPGC